MERKDVKPEYRWNLDCLFDSEDAWRKQYAACREQIGTLAEFKGKLDKKETVLQYLRTDEGLAENIMRLAAYAQMRLDEDSRLAASVERNGRADGLFAAYAAETAFVVPELVKLPEETLQAFAADPDFSDYDYFFRKLIKEKPHVLSENEEKLLAELSEVTGSFRDVFQMLDNADLNLPAITVRGEQVQLTHGTYSLLMQDTDRRVRKRAFEAYYSAYRKIIHTLATVYNANVKRNHITAKLRGYDSCLSRALSTEDVPETVYRNLLDAVNDSLPVLHDYVAYKKKALGLKNFFMYDMYVPVVEGADLKLSYEDAFKLVKEGLAVLGEDYGKLLDEAYSGGWIDVEETEGKRSGAYSMGVYSCHPFVLLNYQQTTHDVFTIAHELGHAIHSYSSNAAQPAAKADYVIFVAEVASTVNEVLLLKHITATTQDAKLKKYLLSYLTEMLRTTLFRQTQFAEFETVAHGIAEADGTLTHETLSEEYLKLNQKYYGSTVEDDGCIQLEWSRIPHFYNAFYVYKYATGIISAVSIADRILSEGQPAVKAYREFLNSGGSDSPVELLKKAGVDLTTKAPYERAMKLFKETLEQLKNEGDQS